jgi:hypothetical protein
MNYIDYKTYAIAYGNVLNSFVYKRKSFAHEQELRAMYMKMPLGADGKLDFDPKNIPAGNHVHVDLDVLVEKIYVAPTAVAWFYDLVRSVSAKYGIVKPIIRSDLDAAPVF